MDEKNNSLNETIAEYGKLIRDKCRVGAKKDIDSVMSFLNGQVELPITKIIDYSLGTVTNSEGIELFHPSKEITIEILDVYPGLKYKDTCVNFIMPEYYEPLYLGSQGSDVIPDEEH